MAPSSLGRWRPTGRKLASPASLALWLLISLGFAAPPMHLCAQDQPDEIQFEQHILPIFQQYCLDCHNADEPEAALNLESEIDAFRGGDSGETAIFPGDSLNSHLVQRLVTENPAERMPPDSDALPTADIDTIKKWIDQKDHWKSIAKSASQTQLDHWAFQPLTKPKVPVGTGSEIDRFVRQRLSSAGLQPSDTASPRTRLRRLSLVLHGLPADPLQLTRFEESRDPLRWSQLVDQYLQSPRYGERWAAHWLDLARYGDTHGFETNRERPNAWRYRDWVIDALNQDLPYDEFVSRQIAGDALGDDVATGFLVAGPYDLVKGQDPLLGLVQRQDELTDMINTTGTAFLGLTLGCARCHNHKFDPISQKDFYSLQAIFAGVQHGDRQLALPADQQMAADQLKIKIDELWSHLKPYLQVPVQFDQNEDTFPQTKARFVRMLLQQCTGGEPCIDELEIFSHGKNVALASLGATATSSGDFVHPLHKLEHINDGQYGNERSWISASSSGGWIQIQFPEATEIQSVVWGRDRTGQYKDRLATAYQIQVSLDGQDWKTVASSDNRLPFPSSENSLAIPQIDTAHLDDETAAQVDVWSAELRDALQEQQKLGDRPVAYAGVFQQPGPTHRLYRGEPNMPREQVAPAGITSLAPWSLPNDAPERERRLRLAQWITSLDNPLTARVIVNRIWQHHFGTGIVATPSDFGANGVPPTHPELLDWLACELIENDWSLKHIHRLILNSETWQQSSLPNPDALAKDASSQLLWRFPPRRLAAESIRDSMLSVTGKLDLTMGGPGFSAFEVEAENVRHYHPKSSYGPEDWRRMIYMSKVRQERDAVFGVFDCPDFSQVVANRSHSTTPLQALNLFNSPFVLQQAQLFADRLQNEAPTSQRKIELAYQLCFGRSASESEIQAAQQFVNQSDWVQFSRAMLNANEFLFIP